MDAYSYLTTPAVCLQRPGESDAAAMARLLSTPAEEVSRDIMYDTIDYIMI